MINKIANIAVKSLITEVCTTPKPGLVDLLSNGSHTDMTVQTFLDSAKSLFPYFSDIVEIAATWENSLPELFLRIRNRGIIAESEMFNATNGVNTHKGLIFSEGILAAATSYAITHFDYVDSTIIFKTAKEMVYEKLQEDFFNIKNKTSYTNGEKLFKKYGYTGIKGEAQNGFQTVQNISLPALTFMLKQGKDENLARVQTLFLLMQNVDDTNVLHRGNSDALSFVKDCATIALQKGGAFSNEGLSFITSLDSIFIEKNISSGGCADLLAVSVMMYEIQQMIDTIPIKITAAPLQNCKIAAVK